MGEYRQPTAERASTEIVHETPAPQITPEFRDVSRDPNMEYRVRPNRPLFIIFSVSLGTEAIKLTLPWARKVARGPADFADTTDGLFCLNRVEYFT
jgi:hypothetical protein